MSFQRELSLVEELLSSAPASFDEQLGLLTDILAYVARTSGLRKIEVDKFQVRLSQEMDGKSIVIDARALEDVLFRSDTNGVEFIQVNFSNGNKILLTDTLIGFKPTAPKGVDLMRLPRVVTTPDVMSVFEAIQDALHSTNTGPHEIAILKRIFDAVLAGGEAVGFDLSEERSWLARVPVKVVRACS